MNKNIILFGLITFTLLSIGIINADTISINSGGNTYIGTPTNITSMSARLQVNGTIYTNNLVQLASITLPSCTSITAGSIGRNSTKLYFCDGSIWNGLY